MARPNIKTRSIRQPGPSLRVRGKRASGAVINNLMRAVLLKLWTPTQIITDLWLDASDLSTIIEVAGAVDQWGDKSGNSNHSTQIVNAERPTSGVEDIGGLNAIDFDELDDFMNLSFPITTTPDYICIGISDRPFVAGNDQLFVGGAFNTGYPVLWNGAGLFTRYDGFVALGSRSLIGVHILAGIRDAANDTWINLDGEIVGTKVATTPPNLEITEVGRFVDTLGTFKQEGPIGEIILTKDNSTATIQNLEGYLAWKWDAVANLPSDHPYKNDPPMTPVVPTVTNGNGDTIRNSSGGEILT